MQARQDIIVQGAPGAPVQHLAFREPLALQAHQPAGHFGAGLDVDQAFSGRAGDFNFLLAVQAAVAFIAQQQHPAQTALAPQGHGPTGFAKGGCLNRTAQLLRREAGSHFRQPRQSRDRLPRVGQGRAKQRRQRAQRDQVSQPGSQHRLAQGVQWLANIRRFRLSTFRRDLLGEQLGVKLLAGDEGAQGGDQAVALDVRAPA